MSAALIPLLDHLAALPEAGSAWAGWAITRIGGGANNRVYRATRSPHDLAVKFAIRDGRDRAGREHLALAALAAAGLDVAPRPLLLLRDCYPQPVTVQTWLAGDVSPAPPADDAGWHALLDHLAAVHTVTPGRVPTPFPPAVLPITDAGSGLRCVREQVARIPPDARPADLVALVARAEARRWPLWPPPPHVLCHCDPNPANYVRRPGGWAAVDWENAGWGDPAFAVADLITHPAYAAVPDDRWEWVIATYHDHCGDVGIETRIRTYTTLMRIWWVARFARAVYETTHGTEALRLVPRGDTWQRQAAAKYAHALARALATAALA